MKLCIEYFLFCLLYKIDLKYLKNTGKKCIVFYLKIFSNKMYMLSFSKCIFFPVFLMYLYSISMIANILIIIIIIMFKVNFAVNIHVKSIFAIK